MTAGASSSGSGTGNGRRRGMGREGEEDENSGSEHIGNEAEDEGDSDDELVIERAARSVSEGHYKKMPKDGEPKLGVVHFLDGAFIEEPKYMKTLNGIVRALWDEKTIYTKGKEREKFWDDVIEEFKVTKGTEKACGKVCELGEVQMYNYPKLQGIYKFYNMCKWDHNSALAWLNFLNFGILV